MKGIFKKVCSLLLVFILSLSGSVSFLENSAHAQLSNISGDISWEIVDNVLYIEAIPGTSGKMEDYGSGMDAEPAAPWIEENYSKVVVSSGVTSIGNNAFFASPANEVILPEGVKRIGDYSFFSMSFLQNLNVPASVTSIGEYAFSFVYNEEGSTIIDFQCTKMPQIGQDAFYAIGIISPGIFYVQSPYIEKEILSYNNEEVILSTEIIGKSALKELKISTIVEQLYSGKAIKPQVRINQGTYTLIENVDYKLSYQNNIKPGKATVTITGLGYYEGTVSVSFTIKVGLNKDKATMYSGDTTQLQYLGATSSVKWTSSNSKIAKVDATGKVTALKAGTATITAKADGVSKTCKITVKNNSMNKSKVSIVAGNKVTLSIIGASAKVTWKSSNTKIATVSSTGVVTAKKQGTAKITATYRGKKYISTITVMKKPSVIVKDVTMEMDILGGVSPTISFSNDSSKKMKYVTFNVAFYNGVNDPALCTVRNRYKFALKATGPINVGASVKRNWEVQLYNVDTRKITIQTIDVIFMDGTKETIKLNRSWTNMKYPEYQ